MRCCVGAFDRIAFDLRNGKVAPISAASIRHSSPKWRSTSKTQKKVRPGLVNFIRLNGALSDKIVMRSLLSIHNFPALRGLLTESTNKQSLCPGTAEA
jgi:hypothetical protein